MEKLELPRIAFGTWAMGGGDSWGKSDDSESLYSLSLAMELGFTYFDTAPAYGNGRSEVLLGKAIKNCRDKVIVASKCGLEWGESGSMLHKERDGVKVWRNLRKDAIVRQVEASLSRLDTDYIDVLLTHWQCPVDPIDETIEALEELKKSGKIRAWGSCNNTPESFLGYLSNGHSPILFQERWSLLERGNEGKLRTAEENGVMFQAYSSMERGLLTGKVKPEDIIEGSAKKSDPWFRRKNIERVNKALSPLSAMADEEGVPLSVLINAYSLSLSPAMGLVLGARKREQVKENAGILSYTLNDEKKKRIDSIWVKPEKEEA
ncbi:MAG: aldo/keto reductase [Candidatus Ornithospirochaeta sp.]